MGNKTVGNFELFARCASGFERVLARELKELRMRRVRPLQGGVAFFGTKADAYRACLWSRVATRVQLVLARVDAADANTLYRTARSIPWEDIVRVGATVAVDAHGTNAKLRNSAFTALKVKDALCDRLAEVRRARPNVDTRHPDCEIDVALHEARATLYLNLSGPSLHRRGYREDGIQTEAPLKETLAAGILLAADWPELAQSGGLLADPMCGSGTIAVEAALVCVQAAPGLLRARWGHTGWAQHDDALWEQVVADAQERLQETTAALGWQPRIVACDINAAAVDIARANARRAGVEHLIRFHVGDAAQLGRYLKRLRGASGPDAPGLLASNPPYGLRISDQQGLPAAYAALSAAIEVLPVTWQVALITPDAGIDSALGRRPRTTLPCYNGPIRTAVRQYVRSDGRLVHEIVSLRGAQTKVPLAEGNSTQFAARLRKVAKERGRRARKAHTCCYRVYDADLPEYAVSVDWYGAAATPGVETPACAGYAVVREYARPAKVDDEHAARKLADARSLVAATLGIPAANVQVHAWIRPQDRKRQHIEYGEPQTVIVQERGLYYRLDLAQATTPLPLDQRQVRAYVREHAGGRRVAGLFAWGSAALVAAVAGGAKSTCSVDFSQESLDWVRSSMELNDLRTDKHHSAPADPRDWLAREAKARRTYDLIVCAPPEWAGRRQTGGRDWDLQRDYETILHAARNILAEDGRLLFVCVAPNVALRNTALADCRLAPLDLSAPDFARSRTPLRCWCS